jgi:hypothetical protein
VSIIDFYAGFGGQNAPWQIWSHFTTGEDLSVTIPEAWAELIHPLNETHFDTLDDRHYDISKDAHRWAPLGKKVLIIDVDTRLDTSKGSMLGKGRPLTRDTIKPRTAGIINHFHYALVHGYDYRLVRAPEFQDRHQTWVKVPIAQEALKSYDFVVFLDADAIFNYVQIPLEWLLSLWDITPQTLVAMAEDPHSARNSDAKGWVMWNTGFSIAQQSERTQELYQRWLDCPTESGRYENCTKWAYDWAHEQAAFANHVRYDYDVNKDIRAISCQDGNGMPGSHGGAGCNGVFVRHYWIGKDQTIRDLYELFSEDKVRELQRFFHERIDDYFLDLSQHTYPLKDVVF